MDITLDTEELGLLICAVEAFLIIPENDPENIGLDNYKQIENLLRKLNETYYKRDY